MSAVVAPAVNPIFRPPAAADIFHPRHYAGGRRPLSEASTLPPWAYTSEEFYRREVETIWMKEWNFFGRADRIPDPGDYFAVDFVGVPIIVIRGKDGEVRAFSSKATTVCESLLGQPSGLSQGRDPLSESLPKWCAHTSDCPTLYTLHNWVFVVTNALLLVTAALGELIFLRNRRSEHREPATPAARP